MSLTLLPRISALPQAEPFRRTLAGRLVLSVAASAFVAACAHISVPLPFTPVPTTMQTFAVILVGMLLGPVEAFAALALYLAEGAAGLPVFSPHGVGGIAQLLGPTGGYLFAYTVPAAMAGLSVRRLRRYMPAFPAALLSGLVALVPVFALGAAWLAQMARLSSSQALHLAVLPFLGVEALKLSAAAAAYSSLSLARRK